MKRPEEFKASNPRKTGIGGAEVTASLAAFVAQCLKKYGIEENKIDEIALGVMQQFLAMYSGHNIYIPIERQEKISQRDSEIYDRFSKNEISITDIASEYGISIQWAYHIIRNMRAKLKAERAQQTKSERDANHERWKREN